MGNPAFDYRRFIGVAVVVAIDIANTSSQKAFELSVENLTGTATR
jgi:hypothetical protein